MTLSEAFISVDVSTVLHVACEQDRDGTMTVRLTEVVPVASKKAEHWLVAGEDLHLPPRVIRSLANQLLRIADKIRA